MLNLNEFKKLAQESMGMWIPGPIEVLKIYPPVAGQEHWGALLGQHFSAGDEGILSRSLNGINKVTVMVNLPPKNGGYTEKDVLALLESQGIKYLGARTSHAPILFKKDKASIGRVAIEQGDEAAKKQYVEYYLLPQLQMKNGVPLMKNGFPLFKREYLLRETQQAKEWWGYGWLQQPPEPLGDYRGISEKLDSIINTIQNFSAQQQTEAAGIQNLPPEFDPPF